jgi:hypothetical protein
MVPIFFMIALFFNYIIADFINIKEKCLTNKTSINVLENNYQNYVFNSDTLKLNKFILWEPKYTNRVQIYNEANYIDWYTKSYKKMYLVKSGNYSIKNEFSSSFYIPKNYSIPCEESLLCTYKKTYIKKCLVCQIKDKIYTNMTECRQKILNDTISELGFTEFNKICLYYEHKIIPENFVVRKFAEKASWDFTIIDEKEFYAIQSSEIKRCPKNFQNFVCFNSNEKIPLYSFTDKYLFGYFKKLSLANPNFFKDIWYEKDKLVWKTLSPGNTLINNQEYIIVDDISMSWIDSNSLEDCYEEQEIEPNFRMWLCFEILIIFIIIGIIAQLINKHRKVRRPMQLLQSEALIQENSNHI